VRNEESTLLHDQARKLVESQTKAAKATADAAKQLAKVKHAPKHALCSFLFSCNSSLITNLFASGSRNPSFSPFFHNLLNPMSD
jgi:hypothetical protein